MPLIRIIAFAAIFWLLYRLVLKLITVAQRPSEPPRTGGDSGTMVRCEQCGLHVPQGEALTKEGKSYCCEEHRDAGTHQ